MSDSFTAVLVRIQNIVWGPPTLFLLLATGLYLTIRMKGLQFTKLILAFRCIFVKEEGKGDVSPFASLCTALAATIGTGSIVGVATALRLGGPGALFWMWVSAIVGMVTKYTEGVLAVKFRTLDEKGNIAGGPMYYIEQGLGKNWIWLAKIFAVFGMFTAMFGSGTFPQVNAITESTSAAFNIPIPVIGIIVTLLTGAVIIGGLKSISRAAEFIVPSMAFFYITGAIIILVMSADRLPGSLALIFESAFKPSSVMGGVSGTVVISLLTALRTGIARGVYTNEAGLGSTPIVIAAAKTKSCVREGLISMTSVFITTIIVCSMTGLVIINSGLLETSSLDGGLLSNAAFNLHMPANIGVYIVTVGLIFFSFTTILGWNYYGERCVVYLTGGTKFIMPYKIAYILCLAIAPYLRLDAIWQLADITNACMAFPNLIALLGLSPVAVEETKKFFASLKAAKGDISTVY